MQNFMLFRFGLAVWLAAVALVGSANAQVPLSEITNNNPVTAPGDRMLGKSDAPVTIFEYASLTCPHCAAFNADTMPSVKASWIDTGKAKLIFRDFPLDKLALDAAVIVRCVPPEHAFDLVDKLFRDQKNWAEIKDDDKSLARIAELAGLDKAKAAACIGDNKLVDAVVNERLLGGKYGVNATPTFFINNRTLVGEMPYADFDKALQEAAKP